MEGTKPAGFKEFTPRAVVCGLAVAVVMGAAYPYVVLKLGFGPNISVVAAFFGYLTLGLILPLLFRPFGWFKDYNRWENNIVQTAGTSAGQLSFMCVLLAAFDMLAASKNVSFHISLTPVQSFFWLTTAGLLGVFLSVPMRQHFVVDEKLPFPDGTAAGETLMVLDARGSTAKTASAVMLLGLGASALLMFMTEDAHVLKWFPSVFLLGTAVMQTMGFGLNWSLLSIGSGMIVGMRIDLSMLIGAVLSWVIAPYALMHYGIIAEPKKLDVLFWVMWPATGMLVAGGLTALFLRWRILVKTFHNLAGAHLRTDEFPMRWVIAGSVASAVALVIVQKVSLGLPVWMTVVSILLSVPLMLVCVRVLGETNWAPISPLSNLMQGIFGAIAPGNLAANMLASGTTGTIATGAEALMQDYKAGHMIGSSPKYLTYMQIMATPVGAAAVSYVYPLLRDTYGIVGEHAQLTSPISRKWAGFAEVLSQGFSALPQGAIHAFVIFGILGVILTVIEQKHRSKVPSPTGIGIGMLVPASVVVMMFVGGAVGWFWAKKNKLSCEAYSIPLASGLIAGEAIVAILVPILALLGLVHI